ncbi:winged helix-turn-helix transcriptional regulator, partial [Mycobacterium rufum]|nr:winged helix-turn-helix transcriptional regulator [Mycolicibacterium rufum]
SYDDNLVHVHISSLRRKMEAHGPRILHTVRGIGYRLQAPARCVRTATRRARRSRGGARAARDDTWRRCRT